VSDTAASAVAAVIGGLVLGAIVLLFFDESLRVEILAAVVFAGLTFWAVPRLVLHGEGNREP